MRISLAGAAVLLSAFAGFQSMAQEAPSQLRRTLLICSDSGSSATPEQAQQELYALIHSGRALEGLAAEIPAGRVVRQNNISISDLRISGRAAQGSEMTYHACARVSVAIQY